MADQKIRIRLKACDHAMLDKSAKEITLAAQRAGARVMGQSHCQQSEQYILFCVLRLSTRNRENNSKRVSISV